MITDISTPAAQRKFFIDADRLNYAVPAEVILKVRIEDRDSRRPVELAIQNVGVTINSIEVDPIMMLLKQAIKGP